MMIAACEVDYGTWSRTPSVARALLLLPVLFWIAGIARPVFLFMGREDLMLLSYALVGILGLILLIVLIPRVKRISRLTQRQTPADGGKDEGCTVRGYHGTDC
jgi:hypothetical protein